MTNFTPFDVADYLDNEETVAAYLSAALEDPYPDAFLFADTAVSRARDDPTDQGFRFGTRKPLQGTFARCQTALRNGNESGAGARGEFAC